MNVALQNASGADLSALVGDLKTLGVDWVRMDFVWGAIQPTGPNDSNTAPWDAAVRAASQQGIRVMGIICYSAPWTNGGQDQMVPPTNASDYGRYAGFLAGHFAALGVHAWEIWNEPNISPFWSTGADPTKYAAMLKAGYTAIKAADPQATVVTAGLSGAADGGGDLSPQTFLKGVYDAIGNGYFDAVGDHPYTYPDLPNATNGGAYWWNAMNDLRSIMTQHGDSAKQIWLTEYGAPTNGPSGSGVVTESIQASMLSTAYQMSEENAWAGPLFWYDYRDSGTSTDTSENFYGIVRFDGSKKPAYAAYQAVPH